jgi:hypothetical protein
MGKYYLGTGTTQYNFQVVDSTGVIYDLNLSGLYLSITGKAADADKLDGYDGSYYLNSSNFTGFFTGIVTGDAAVFNSITFNTGLGLTSDPAEIVWNDTQASLSLGLLGGSSTNLGQDLISYVRNAETGTISKGQAVYLFGAQGDKATVKLASNLSDTTSSKTLGLAVQNIAAGQLGYVKSVGVVDGLNLGAYNAGDVLWLGTTPGSLTATKPQAPYHMVFIGVIERANNGNGQIYVRVQNGYELEELHDVNIIAPTDNSILVYNSGSGVWHNTDLLELNGTGTHYVSGNFGIGASTVTNTKLLIDSPSGYTGTLIESKVNGDTKFKVDYHGNVICGPKAPIATNATNGFMYVPICSGVPSGTPASYSGVAPIIIDTANNKLYFYSNGVWRDSSNPLDRSFLYAV